MNGGQRVVLVVAALMMAGMAIYPPWAYKGGASPGYSWIFKPPTAVDERTERFYEEIGGHSETQSIASPHDPLGLVSDEEWRKRQGPPSVTIGVSPRPDIPRLALQFVFVSALAGAGSLLLGSRSGPLHEARS